MTRLPLMEPFHDRVLVLRFAEDTEKKTAGGLYTPDISKERPTEGEVLAVGRGRLLENGTFVFLDAKVGDLVLFGKYAGTTVPEAAHPGLELEKGESVIILREDEILGRSGDNR